MNGKISIIVPTYNHEKHISRALESIAKQSLFKQCEVIVGNDASTDGTEPILNKFQENYDNVRVLNHKHNMGFVNNYKSLLGECSNQFVAVLEGDDFWISEDKLTAQLDVMTKDSSLSACFSAFYTLNGDTGKIENRPKKKDNRYALYDFLDLLDHNCPGSFTNCLYRRDLLKRAFDSVPAGANVADWYMNLFVSELGGFMYIPARLSVYRVHQNGLWSGLGNQQASNMMLETLNRIALAYPQYKCFVEDKIQRIQNG